MKKVKQLIVFSVLIATINLSFNAIADAAICFNGDCYTTVYEDDYGYSWFIYCNDGTSASGRTVGAEYVGACAVE